MNPLKEATNFTNEHEFSLGNFAPSRLCATFFQWSHRWTQIFTDDLSICVYLCHLWINHQQIYSPLSLAVGLAD